MHRWEKYLRDMHDIRATGAATKVTSYYPALHRLLSAIGEKLKSKVRCVMNLKNQGAGVGCELSGREGGDVRLENGMRTTQSVAGIVSPPSSDMRGIGDHGTIHFTAHQPPAATTVVAKLRPKSRPKVPERRGTFGRDLKCVLPQD
jgi:hypothetical protein